MSETSYYIIKRADQKCEIVPASQISEDDLQVGNSETNESDIIEKWGPFADRNDAIARRIGLIRAGKCQPQ